MRNLTLLFALLLILTSCASKQNSEFLIMKIRPEKDGKTLFLENNKGEVFTTIISIPNGNFIEVNQGDRISLEIKEIIKMNPPAIVSKNIQIVKETNDEKFKTKWTGTISKQEVSFHQYGTHTFKGNVLDDNPENKHKKIQFALKSDKINLNKWIDKDVIITGRKIEGYPIEGGPDYINVIQIEEN